MDWGLEAVDRSVSMTFRWWHTLARNQQQTLSTLRTKVPQMLQRRQVERILQMQSSSAYWWWWRLYTATAHCWLVNVRYIANSTLSILPYGVPVEWWRTTTYCIDPTSDKGTYQLSALRMIPRSLDRHSRSMPWSLLSNAAELSSDSRTVQLSV